MQRYSYNSSKVGLEKGSSNRLSCSYVLSDWFGVLIKIRYLACKQAGAYMNITSSPLKKRRLLQQKEKSIDTLFPAPVNLPKMFMDVLCLPWYKRLVKALYATVRAEDSSRVTFCFMCPLTIAVQTDQREIWNLPGSFALWLQDSVCAHTPALWPLLGASLLLRIRCSSC